MRMVSSPGKSIRRRREICPGLHALAHRRCCRRPCRRPFQATAGPTTAAPPGVATAPDRRSCTYVRRAAVVASLALFGRRAARSACHCAVVARYAKPPLRVAALRRNSREIVDGARLSWRAISRMPWPRARHSAISSRSANTRYRSDGGFADGASVVGGMPPASRNQRPPTAGDTPASIAAASLDRPAAIAAQNRRRFSRCATPGRPGDPGNTARSARSERRLPALIATPSVKVLRRQLESTHSLENVELTGKRARTHVAMVHADGQAEPWIIAMSERPTTERARDYGLRWGIEAMFSDFKTRGFNLEASQIERTDRLDRLILVLALALYWAVSTGLWDATKNRAPAEKKPRQRNARTSPAA